VFAATGIGGHSEPVVAAAVESEAPDETGVPEVPAGSPAPPSVTGVEGEVEVAALEVSLVPVVSASLGAAWVAAELPEVTAPAVGLKKTIVSWAVLSGSSTVTSTTNWTAPASGPEAGEGVTVPRNTYPRSPAEPMTICSVPASSTGVPPNPETVAVNHAPEDDRQTLLSTVALDAVVDSAGVTPAEDENDIDGPLVERSTAGESATPMEFESPSGWPELKPAPGGVTPLVGTHVATGSAAAAPEVFPGFTQE